MLLSVILYHKLINENDAFHYRFIASWEIWLRKHKKIFEEELINSLNEDDDKYDPGLDKIVRYKK